jgi:hypothetical protein
VKRTRYIAFSTLYALQLRFTLTYRIQISAVCRTYREVELHGETVRLTHTGASIIAVATRLIKKYYIKKEQEKQLHRAF